MKKITSFVISIILIFITFLTIILSTIGIETDKFNKLILKKINQANNNISLKINTIKFKLDIKEISLFLETSKPKINYRDTFIPAKNIRVYIDFISLLKSDAKIKKINLDLEEININELNKLSNIIKPSNFKNLINNKVKEGKLTLELDIYLDEKNLFDNFIARGTVSNLKIKIINDINLEKANFTFFADKTDVLIKNFFGNTGPINIVNGDLKIKLSQGMSLDSNFKTIVKYNNDFKNYKHLIKNLQFAKHLKIFDADLSNSFSLKFDKTYKVKKYNFKSNGKVAKANLYFKNPSKFYFLQDDIKQLSFQNSEIKIDLNSIKNSAFISGKYALNKGNFLPFNLDNTIKNDLLEFKLDTEYEEFLNFELINYKKPKDKIANISINFDKVKNNINIKELNFVEGNNVILINGIKFDNNKFTTLKKISIKTNKNNKKNNDFSINYGKKILIKGTHFDATNLPKILNKNKKENIFLKINKNIEIDFTNIAAPLSENLKNFKLIGYIKNGVFVKISSKGDFGNNNFLDISMKYDKKNQKKYLEIYSDLTRPLLTEYSFFNGLTGGKLLYSSIMDVDSYTSRLKIENFKVINAPGMIKLLSLADLGGLADLAVGEGLSFDILEINMSKNKDLLNFNEILALGPSVSVLMEGYQNKTITSLRGTLIPAKTLNIMISKIPLLGDIIVPKEAGEGLFGISFKMKGPPGSIKTTINPIRTITPRFIQKIIDRNKKTK